MTPQLVAAHTYHKRIGGPANAFRYSVDYVLSEPDANARLPWLMSRNRFNLTSLNDADHGGARGNGRGADWVRAVLADHGLQALVGMRVLLLAQPRMLGFLFNPVSFWLIIDGADQLRAFIAEVNNTFGERHSYLCHHPELTPIQPTDTLTSAKVFHVSPFQDVGGTYGFRFGYTPDHISVRIDFRMGKDGLLATLAGDRKPLTSAVLMKSVLRRPFGSARVVFLIYWQAMVLRRKGVRVRPVPAPPKVEVTR